MTLSDILTPDAVVADMQAKDRWEAIDELLAVLAQTGVFKSQDLAAVTQAVKNYEAQMSTGVGLGVAIPHVSTELVTSLAFAFGRSKTGIEFESLDQMPVHVVCLFLVPQGQFQNHMTTLSNILRTISDRQFRDNVRAASDATQLVEIIRTQKLLTGRWGASDSHQSQQAR